MKNTIWKTVKNNNEKTMIFRVFENIIIGFSHDILGLVDLFLVVLAVVLLEELFIIVLFIDRFHHAIIHVGGAWPVVPIHDVSLIDNLFLQPHASEALVPRS